MGQIYVKASRRAKAYTRRSASEGTRVYSSRHSALHARKRIGAAFNSRHNTAYAKKTMKKHLKQIEWDLKIKRQAGSRISAYRY